MLAEQARLANVRFAVANVDELELPPESFDVVHFSNVLRYLREPERALGLAFRSLKSGGMLAACEGHNGGDWIAGPNAESVMLVRRISHDANGARGGDPLMGGRLHVLVRQAGFERIQSRPGYSAALSNTRAFGAAIRGGWRENFRPMLMQNGISTERCDQLLDEISVWVASEDSPIAVAECAVIGWKP
jgi:SAM-dependent methyltransferase